ncbi:MAG: hypothetical protein M1608_03565 [Candidatus Omnitrophica bacterium]|nr:hypothetical protein [Candidatus Omnitrophota bacterium]
MAIETNAAARPVRAPTVNANFKGLCAIFAITNAGKRASVWFDTCAVEQRVGSGWRRFEVQPYNTRGYPETGGANPWHGIASDMSGADLAPGTYLNYAVEWPREVPTNASWRLELLCGIEPSTAARKWDANLGIRWFTRRRNGQTIYTAEVRR